MTENNRVLTVHDEKEQRPDFPLMPANPPATDIYDGELKYYAANAEWSQFVDGWMRWLATAAAWQDEQDESGHKIEQITTFILGVEPMTLTVEEICEGVTCALAKAGTALAAGLNSNIQVSVDDDGNIIVDTGEDGEGDVITSDEALDGAAHYTYNRILEFIQDYEDFFTIFPASEANAKVFFTNKYLLTAQIDQAISDYYDHRDLMNPQPMPPDDGLIENYWCGGLTKQTTATYIIEESASDQLLLLSMLDALSQDQYDAWSIEGANQPRDDYRAYGCFPLPDIEVLIPLLVQNVEYGLGDLSNYANLGHDRLIRVRTTGTLIGANGEIITAVHYKDTSDVVHNDFWNLLAWNVGGGFPVNIPPAPPLEFNEDGIYTWIISMPDRNYTTMAVRSNHAFATTTGGSITFTFEDLLEDE